MSHSSRNRETVLAALNGVVGDHLAGTVATARAIICDCDRMAEH